MIGMWKAFDEMESGWRRTAPQMIGTGRRLSARGTAFNENTPAVRFRRRIPWPAACAYPNLRRFLVLNAVRKRRRRRRERRRYADRRRAGSPPTKASTRARRRGLRGQPSLLESGAKDDHRALQYRVGAEAPRHTPRASRAPRREQDKLGGLITLMIKLR